MDVSTREAEEVNDFTTLESTFRIPTVTNPITMVLRSTPIQMPTSLQWATQTSWTGSASSAAGRRRRSPPASTQSSDKRSSWAWDKQTQKGYKFSHKFCWKIEIFDLPFISFSITTPAKPARPEEQMVRTMGRNGSSSSRVCDLAIWMEATLDVRRNRAAHCTPESLLWGNGEMGTFCWE